jgi:hypothetical protein
LSRSGEEKEKEAMSTISLAPYTIRVRRRGEKTAFLPLGRLDAADDAFDRFLGFFKNLKTRHDRASKTFLRHIRFEPDSPNRVLEGILETGEYGYEAELIDVDANPPKPTHRRRASEAELLPFYFRLDVPQQADQGFLILQRFGNLGIKAAMEDALVQFFAGTPYLVELHPLVPEKVIEKWTHAMKVRRLRLVSFKVPQTITRAFQLGDSEEVYSELVIRARKGHTFPLPARLRNKNGEGFVEVQEMQEEIKELRRRLKGIFAPDTLKVEVSVAGRTRTLDMTDPGNLVAYHDVTEAVSPLGRNGHPDWEKIREEARKLAMDLRETVQKLPAASPAVPPRPRAADVREAEIDRKAG